MSYFFRAVLFCKRTIARYVKIIAMKKKIISSKISQTRKLAADLAGHILKLALRPRFPQRSSEQAIVIGLSGELGSGKTAFCQSFAKALGVKEKVHSPTFVIFRKHEIRSTKYETNSKFKNLYHFDVYRIKKTKEIIDLGWKKIVSEPKNIILVEWAENVRKIFPKKHFWINLSYLGKNKRGIDIKLIK